MTSFSIEPPALSGQGVDRSEDLRDPRRIAAAWPDARVLVIGTDGELPLVGGGPEPALQFEPARALSDAPLAGAILLGRFRDADYWAIVRDQHGAADTGVRLLTAKIRLLSPLLAEQEAELATTALALIRWHASALFCSRCGRPTAADLTGHSRVCDNGHQEFPRTDPAVIVLVHDGAGNAVLARQPSWQPGRFSVLAGFAEAGESLEGTVVREIGEEIGVRVHDLHYLGSQPWPFPRSLMIAFSALAPTGALLRPRQGEIDDARWFSAQELRQILAREDSRQTGLPHRDAHPAERGDGTSPVTLPGPVSIARRMVEGFVASHLG